MGLSLSDSSSWWNQSSYSSTATATSKSSGLGYAAVAAGALQAYGSWSSNLSRAKEEADNANWLEQQADYAIRAMARGISIREIGYTQQLSQQISGYAGSGVAISGSAAVTTAGNIKNLVDETAALRDKAYMEANLLRKRAALARKASRTLGSFEYNALKTVGFAASMAANYYTGGAFSMLGGNQMVDMSINAGYGV